MLKVAFFISGVLSCMSHANAMLQVYPTRVLLTDQKKAAHLSLRLIGNKPEKYRISTVFYRMKPSGALEKVNQPTPLERPANDLIRYSPHEVTLNPQIEQVVRILIFANKPLDEAEYRAHIYFEPIQDDIEMKSPATDKAENVSMLLSAKIAVAVPVFFRHGKTSSKITLSQLKLLDLKSGEKAFEVKLGYQGNRFPFGDFKAIFSTQEKSDPIEIAYISGVSSYIKDRNVSFALKPPSDINLKSGKLRLDYQEPKEDGGKLLDSIEVEIK